MCWQVTERPVLTSALKTKEPKQQTGAKHGCSRLLQMQGRLGEDGAQPHPFPV